MKLFYRSMSQVFFGVVLPLLFSQAVLAQGCILTRNMSPVLGAQISPYLQKGESQLSANYRQFTADTQYQGTELSQPVSRLGTQVISKMRYMELSGVYALTQQWNLEVGIPYVLKASSNRALPSSAAGSPRYTQSTSGLGDLTVGARHWFMDCAANPDRNFALGLGVKAPTGEKNSTDLFPNAAGQDFRERGVDQSILLGDGGWGFNLNAIGFMQFGDYMVFANGVYLFNPSGQNDVLSPPSMLNPAGPTAVDQRFRYNSISDSYLVRVGVGRGIPFVPGLAFSVAGRIEGVPVTDVLGDTEGFRRPGYYVTIEPGVNFSLGRAIYNLSVPIRVDQNVKKDSYGIKRDSTFADRMWLMSVAYRFGGAEQ
jgi:Putative MetA-pathway of phenol degradation